MVKKLRLHVSIGKADIANGLPSLPRFCPIALALQRTMTEKFGPSIARQCQPSVGGLRAIIHYDGGWLRAFLPPDAQEFVGSFDYGTPVAPIEFDLDFIHYSPGGRV